MILEEENKNMGKKKKGGWLFLVGWSLFLLEWVCYSHLCILSRTTGTLLHGGPGSLKAKMGTDV